jgi:Putative zinc-finger
MLKNEVLTMQCTHAEKLIPLFAGDDLPAWEADALRRHLESCANCSRLAAEFEESRDWLRGFPAPQFDDALLDGMRDAVLSDIGRIENRARWLQWVIPGLNLRFAASMAALLLIAFLAAYAYRGGRPRIAPGKENVDQANQGGNRKDLMVNERRNDDGNKINPSPVPTGRLSQKQARKVIKKPRIKAIQSPDQVIAKALLPPSPISVEPDFGSPPSDDTARDDAIFNREMTRIEFQTADPNIRIIWLAPKESNSSLTKSNTNTR